MAVVVVGGHSRSVGKTSVVASLIARLPERNWTACKITQFGHGFCSANGESCDCQTDEHTIAISAERDPNTGTDSARFLAAGARRSLWVRTRIGRLADAMPRIRQEIDAAENMIFESNSLLQFLRPDLYLTVLDYATADFKDSARLYLDRADAVLLRASGQQLAPQWNHVSLKLLAGKPRFLVTPPDLIGDDLVAFVEQRLATRATETAGPSTAQRSVGMTLHFEIWVLQKCHPDRSVPGFPATLHWTRLRVRLSVREGRMKRTNATKFHRKSGVA